MKYQAPGTRYTRYQVLLWRTLLAVCESTVCVVAVVVRAPTTCR